jgi:hypothetical protein
MYKWQLVCFMQVMLPLPRRVRFQLDSPRQRPHNLHETYQLPRVQLITPDDGRRRCPKNVEFRDKIKILDTWCILLVIYTKFIKVHVHLNIKLSSVNLSPVHQKCSQTNGEVTDVWWVTNSYAKFPYKPAPLVRRPLQQQTQPLHFNIPFSSYRIYLNLMCSRSQF